MMIAENAALFRLNEFQRLHLASVSTQSSK